MAALVEEETVRVVDQADVEEARRALRRVGARAGLGRVAMEEAAIAVTELASNLVRHAGGGIIEIRRTGQAALRGVEVVSSDDGPGIADVESALSDGKSTAGGLGSGLPAVRRLTDQLSIETGPSGTRVVVRKWAKRERR
jgi:serine/threonine-protein kinase RsbT